MNDKGDELLLEHFGTKGMKWGVRKTRPVRVSSDYKKTAPLRNRKVHELSNKQLQSVNTRINLEQNYKRLNPSKIMAGHDMVKGILAGITTAASVYTLVHSPAGKAFIHAGERFIKRAVRKG